MSLVVSIADGRGVGGEDCEDGGWGGVPGHFMLESFFSSAVDVF